MLLLQNVADHRHPRPNPLLHADAFHPGRRVDHVALRRRLQPRRAGELHGQPRHHGAVVTPRPVVTILERVHGDTWQTKPVQLGAERGHHRLVRRRGENREARAGVDDSSAVAADVPHLGRDFERLAVDGHGVDRHRVERPHAGVEHQRRAPRGGGGRLR
uniref:Uncharacterized protein n=1 Tax=Leersia perrieri TaxID=77586 RepID=A0A0D9WJK0_9ORYZ